MVENEGEITASGKKGTAKTFRSATKIVVNTELWEAHRAAAEQKRSWPL